MTIERVNADRVQFKSLRGGDVFITPKGSILMRIESVYDDDGEHNAVSLEDGRLYYFDEVVYVDKKPTAILKI